MFDANHDILSWAIWLSINCYYLYSVVMSLHYLIYNLSCYHVDKWLKIYIYWIVWCYIVDHNAFRKGVEMRPNEAFQKAGALEEENARTNPRKRLCARRQRSWMSRLWRLGTTSPKCKKIVYELLEQPGHP